MILRIEYAYLALCAPFFVLWVTFFVFSPRNRQKMLNVSVKRAPFGILLDCIYTSDYWSPESILFIQLGDNKFMLESILFAFFLSGIAAVVFQVFFGKKVAIEKKSVSLEKKRSHKLAVCYFCAIVLTLLAMEMGINSIYASSLAYSTIGMVIVHRKPHLFRCCIFTGIFVSALLFTVYSGGRVFITNTEDILQSWWFLYGTELDTRVCNIPLTEIIWGLGYGFTAGGRHNLEILPS